MYNTSLVCSYTTNEQYQQELLAAFTAPHYEELSNNIEQLYHSVEENDKLQELLKKVETKLEWANKDHCFYFLFSYDYFIHTHEYVKDILNHQCPKNHDFLCSLFE
jgi:hypothetical protein